MSERPSSRLLPGNRIGKYTITGLLGRGRKTEVYRAFHPDLKREVAIKLYSPQGEKTPELTACFRREVQAIAALKHPNIVRIYDFDSGGDYYYLVMEFIEGTNLRDLLSLHRTGLNREDALRIFSQLASAVAFAHDQGVVHGNITPDNVLLDTNQRPVLMDFRIPCLVENDQAAFDTPGEGSPTYLAPEQITQGPLNIRSDIYALGIVFYEMITGDVPFKGDTRESVLSQHLNTPPTPPSVLSIGLDPRIEHVILKALNKNPVDRYHSPRDMLVDLEREEAAGQYETLNIDREMVGAVRKRQSEIMRFEMSRTDDARLENLSSGKPSFFQLYFRFIILGVILTIIFIIGLIILLA